MGEYVLEPFIKRYPQFGKEEMFIEQFFTLLKNFHKEIHGNSAATAWLCWSRVFNEISEECNNQRLMCGLLLALYDTGLMGWSDLLYVIRRNSTISRKYFDFWVAGLKDEIGENKRGRAEVVLLQRKEEGDKTKHSKRSANGARRFRGL
tara:strand:- start:1223 stop:1669 length:447 start_codon:yes stop_codon:yes gene_type:complete